MLSVLSCWGFSFSVTRMAMAAGPFAQGSRGSKEGDQVAKLGPLQAGQCRAAWPPRTWSGRFNQARAFQPGGRREATPEGGHTNGRTVVPGRDATRTGPRGGHGQAEVDQREEAGGQPPQCPEVHGPDSRGGPEDQLDELAHARTAGAGGPDHDRRLSRGRGRVSGAPGFAVGPVPASRRG